MFAQLTWLKMVHIHSTVVNNPDLVRYVCTFLSMQDCATIHLTSRLLSDATRQILHYRVGDMAHSRTHTRVEDILLVLRNVHILDLSDCCGITDVSVLGNVHTLDLSNCQWLTDVSALGTVHTLNLSHCRRVPNISTLSNVHTLHVTTCINMDTADISALDGVHLLHLSYYDKMFHIKYYRDRGGFFTLSLADL